MPDQIKRKDLDRLAHAFAPVVPGHLNYDEFEGLLDGTLTAGERSAAVTHLERCVDCRNELSALQAFADDDRVRQPHAVPLRERLGFGWMTLVPVAAAILAVVGGVLWYVGRQYPPQELAVSETQPLVVASPESLPPANGTSLTDTSADNTNNAYAERPPELALSLVDGARNVGLDREGALIGYDGLSPAQRNLVESVLRSGTVTVGPEARDLRNTPSTLMGGPEEGEGSFDLIGPAGKVIMTSRPTLQWKPLAGSTGYRVDVFDTNYNKVASSNVITSTGWSPSLRSGRTYIWQVTAFRDGKEFRSPVRPAPEARFRILDEGRRNELGRLRAQFPKSHLVLAAAYARSGLVHEATQEAEALVKENPNSELAKKLLRQLRSYR